MPFGTPSGENTITQTAPDQQVPAWYTYGRNDNFGSYPDPEGAFPKPDSNIIVPGKTVFTSLFPGTVSGIDSTSSYGQVITIKLDKPLNTAATHIAYLHLNSVSSNLKVGSHVNAGTIVGNGGAGQSMSGAPPGFALTQSDMYGHGSGWADNVKGTWINPLLNPVPVLEAAKAGKLGSLGATDPANTSGSNTDNNICAPWDIACMITNLQPTLVNWGEHIAVFSIALLLVILGVYLLNQKIIDGAAGAVAKVAAV